MSAWQIVGVVLVAIAAYLVIVTVGIRLAKRAAKNLDAWESKRSAEETERRIQEQRAELARMREEAIRAYHDN